MSSADLDHPDYEIIKELGRGGMGVVYLARNKLMGRLEVLKVVDQRVIERPGVIDRFLREIRSAARLRHPNIVTAYSAMRIGASFVLSMEYVEGIDLAKLVKTKGPLPDAHACSFIQQAALGLQHAHERGMVHRDIKPANLILTRDGNKAVVKAIDFGLAKVSSEGESESQLTRQGQLLGTPDYIAPEQIRDAQSADIRADIYSLGCTFYCLLSGGPPFRGDHLWDVYQAHFSMEADPLNLIRPEISVELAAVVAKMMAKEPARRFQTPGQVAQALAALAKKGHESFRQPELSVATHSHSNRQQSIAPSTLVNPVDGAEPSQAPSVSERPEAQSDSGWEGLIDLSASERNADKKPVISETTQSRRWLWPSVAATGLVCVFLGAMASRLLSSPAALTKHAVAGASDGLARPEARITENSDNKTEPRAQPNNDELANPGAVTYGVSKSSEPAQPAPITVVGNSAEEIPIRGGGPTELRSSQPTQRNPPREPGALGFRQIRVFPGIARLSDPDAATPAASFWPSISPTDLQNWQIGDPSHIAMTEKGIRVDAGASGNLLLTREDRYQSCVLDLTLSAGKGTEAFLALHARRGRDGWHALTTRLSEKKGKIRLEPQGCDFQTQDLEGGFQELDPGKAVPVKFELNDRGMARVSVKGAKTPLTPTPRNGADEGAGAVGVFVKSGSVLIERMDVQ